MAEALTVQDLAQWEEEFVQELLDETLLDTEITFVNDIEIKDIIQNFLEFEQELFLVTHHDDTTVGMTFVSDDEVPDIIHNFKDEIEEWEAEIEDELLLKTPSEFETFEDVKITLINNDGVAEIVKKVEPIILNVTPNPSSVSAKANGDTAGKTDVTKLTPAEKKPIEPY
eukprot:TCONS_00004829-protein